VCLRTGVALRITRLRRAYRRLGYRRPTLFDLRRLLEWLVEKTLDVLARGEYRRLSRMISELESPTFS